VEHQTPGERPTFTDTGEPEPSAAQHHPEPAPSAAAPGAEGGQDPGHSSPDPGYEPTGRPDVDAVLDRLSDLEGLPPSDHIDIYEDAHRRLHETLLAAGEDREDRTGRH
jgi:hypothetical protein